LRIDLDQRQGHTGDTPRQRQTGRPYARSEIDDLVTGLR
jgi:hypothetical protein